MKIELMESRVPKIYITNLAMNKIEQYVANIDKEIGWLGTVTKEGLKYTINDVFLFKQEVHSTTTEITPEGLNEFAMELLSTENGIEVWNNMKMWGHSHVNMGTSPSHQDDKQLETFETCGHDFFIRMITNKKGDMRLDLYDYETGIIYKELGYAILLSDGELTVKKVLEEKIASLKKMLTDKLSFSDEQINMIKDEIKEKVTVKTYTYYKPNKNENNNIAYLNNNNQDLYGDWYDEFSYLPCNNSSKKNETEKRKNVNDVFLQLTEEEIFTLYNEIDATGTLALLDYEILKDLTQEEIIILEEDIIEYTEESISAYLQFMEGY